MARSALEGRRVLLVEDELAIAMLLESALEDQCCEIVGPCGSLAEAIAAARDETLDAAVLDINLAGEMVFPAADVLEERGVPFILLSGYGRHGLPHDRTHWRVCGKPFKLDELVSILAELVVPA